MTTLLDANVLIALALDDHSHNDAALSWLAGHDDHFATSPATQGSLVRAVLRASHSAEQALALLDQIIALPDHDFWPDDFPYAEVRFAGVLGQRQVTDAYLAQLARRRGGRLATFDKGLAAMHPDVADLVPIGAPE